MDINKIGEDCIELVDGKLYKEISFIFMTATEPNLYYIVMNLSQHLEKTTIL